ncbi:uncharacterized protein PHACADRAFT_185740 [Phanerochaete carnosa HHB-10118-sp]|uniref:Uncharacterized protein n=1 Tax=Phanerochaete carnosa (strain HHB-10118-sp) TaxID=650164 RepID=K5WWT0_PHACS|nr:uncharacterized protein PHACADRAFT_185740 [Phanerochaete carnosa HHB-10118-sp]EKM54912.1 hypothetical protein PHACADRAFT_185740 [Phanerochaete carnosa HHB-10118-sp]
MFPTSNQASIVTDHSCMQDTPPKSCLLPPSASSPRRRKVSASATPSSRSPRTKPPGAPITHATSSGRSACYASSPPSSQPSAKALCTARRTSYGYSTSSRHASPIRARSGSRTAGGHISPGRCRPPNAEEEAQETWISTWWERERAAREGRTIAYKKFYSQSARGQMLVTYIGGLVAEGSNAGPHDYVDAANIFFDYARTDVFAAEHGGLDAFEYGTLDAVRRAVLWWCRERKLAEIRSTLAAGTTHKSHPRRGQLRINHNSIIVLQQQKQALAKVM